MTTHLWPPLDHLRGAIAGDSARAPARRGSPSAGLQAEPPARYCETDLALPLTELARRREEVAARGFSARWAPGRLVSVLHDGLLLGVLLDRHLPGGTWQGWMAAGEADWAGAFDVLLEPGDEPFEPVFGVVQTWNMLELAPSPMLCARVVGEVSAARLAAIRAVHDEWAAELPLAIAPEPGVIALRSAGGGAFEALTGTPLAPADPRADYQALYRELAARAGLRAQPAAGPVPARPPDGGRSTDAPGGGTGWARVKQWFATDRLVRPALAVLLVAVVVQQAALQREPAEEDAVRFRSVPQEGVSTTAPADLVVRWKPGVRWDDAARLLRALPAEVIGGPDSDGTWQLRTPDAAAAQVRLRSSPLVDSVTLAQPDAAVPPASAPK